MEAKNITVVLAKSLILEVACLSIEKRVQQGLNFKIFHFKYFFYNTPQQLGWVFFNSSLMIGNNEEFFLINLYSVIFYLFS